MSEFRKNIVQRMWARRFALQALYEWQLSQSSLSDIEQNFSENEQFGRADSEYFSELLRACTKHHVALDQIIQPFLDRTIERLDPIEHALLWIGTYELKNRLDIPYKVVINESVELAKKFGADESFRYINGVLDKISQSIRPEMTV